MSNPSLPPMPEPSWPIQELIELARATATLLDATRVWMAFYDRKGAFIPHIAVANDNGSPTPIDPLDRPDLIEHVITALLNRDSVAPLVLPNLLEQPELELLAGQDAAVMRSLAAVALVNDGKMVGALIVAGARTAMFGDDARQALNTLASQVVATIRLTGAVERNAVQARELAALLSASQALTSTLDSDEVFRAIIKSIQGVISCDSALIYRFDERAALLRVIAGMGARPDALEGSVIPLNSRTSKAAWVAQRRRVYAGVVRPEDEIGPHTDALRTSPTISLLCMPLMSKGRLRGVASLARQHAFTPPEVSAMEQLSPIAAAALENVELYQQSQAERQQLEAIFASASDGFALIDDTLHFAQVNPAFARYLAADPSALVGQACCPAFGAAMDVGPNPETCLLCRGEPDCLLRQVMRTRSGRDHVECVFPPVAPSPTPRSALPDGSGGLRPSEGPPPTARTIDFSLTPMEGAERRPRLLLVGRDVSGAREVERFRAEQIQMVSHEMGNPLQTISGNVELFVNFYGRDLTPEQLRMLNTARATTYSIRTLVADLDLISRKDAGQWTINPMPTDLSAEARAAAIEMNLIAQQEGVDLRLAPGSQAPLAQADPARARQVARNLIINAIKFTPKGGRVWVSVLADADWVTLKVEDTGVGIPEDVIPLIWRRFYRAPQPGPTKIKGRGLGLAIVRIIAEAHGGLYDVRSKVGKGTVFTVSFPRADRGERR
ncbi:MAG TPA: ATP-binding protein [Ktedonobacterales bacterium]